MRVFVTFILALLLVGGTAAQESNTASAADEKSFSHSMFQSKRAFVITEPQLEIASKLPPPDRRVFVTAPDSQQNTCWFIRSYIFERRDGEAPVFKRETTCTPSYRNPLRQTKQRGARLIPLGW